MYVLAVDPGVKTGVALLNGEGAIVWTLTCESPYDEVGGALREYKDAEVAFEIAPPSRHYQEVYATVLGEVTQNTKDRIIHLIRPSEWKNHPFCQVKGLTTKHEAEAVGIGRAHILRRKRERTAPAGPGSDREHQESSRHLGDGARAVQDL